jgi:hypothetical protein
MWEKNFMIGGEKLGYYGEMSVKRRARGEMGSLLRYQIL